MNIIPTRKRKADAKKTDSDHAKFRVCLDWNEALSRGDVCLDLSAYVAGADGKTEDIIYYANREHASGCVIHDDDDEQLLIDLDKAPASVSRIAFAVTIHDDKRHRYKFADACNACIGVIKETASSASEMLAFDLSQCYPTDSGIVVGAFQRDGSEWKLQVIGDAFDAYKD